ncbi:MAG: hypothetical protein IKQ09_02095 [Bacteroidales bacterium]|nr:hypothetical protein [Bacteroidales bacterium]
MNLQISHHEINYILSKWVKTDVNIENIEYSGETKLIITAVKPTKLIDLSADIELDFKEIVDKGLVVDVQLGGKFLSWYQKFLTKKWINESHLEWLLREIFDLDGLISIDEEKRDRFTFHLDKVEALNKILEYLEVERISFDKVGMEIIADAI